MTKRRKKPADVKCAERIYRNGDLFVLLDHYNFRAVDIRQDIIDNGGTWHKFGELSECEERVRELEQACQLIVKILEL